MEKVFVITIEDIYDFASTNHKPIIYRKKEDAVKKFEELIESFLDENPSYTNLDNDDAEDFIYEKSEYSFSAYEDGRYGENHYDITISEVELN